MQDFDQQTASGFDELVTATAPLRLPRRVIFLILAVLMPLSLLGAVKFMHTMLPNRALASASAEDEQADVPPGDIAAIRDRVARDPQAIRALNRPQIIALFDQPELKRIEGPYRHWQYETAACIMDIFLKVGDRGAHPVQFIDFRPRHTVSLTAASSVNADMPVDTGACLASIEDQAGTQAVSAAP